MRRIILTPVGSAGDVNPFLWFGRILKERGHIVSMIANGIYRDAAISRGIEFTEIGDVAEYERLVADPTLWHPSRGTPFVLRHAGDATLRLYECILDSAAKGVEPPLIIAPSLAFGARLAHEKHGFPLVSVHLQPSACLSAHDLSAPTPEFAFLPKLPLLLRRAMLALIRVKMDQEVRPGVRFACKAVGVPPPRNAFRDWWQSSEITLCMFPDWFGSPQPDWPAGMHCIGFPLFDQSDRVSIDADLQRFLDDGPPPVLFTPGSAMAHGGDFFRVASGACHRLGVRAIFATAFPEKLPPRLPGEIFVCRYAPFSKVFPKCSAVVHHGGIGTVSQALAAGVPQLIAPMAHDQPDNAFRVQRLGVGSFLWSRDFNVDHVVEELSQLLTSSEIRQQCANVAGRFAEEDPAGRLIRSLLPHLEGTAHSRTRRIALYSSGRIHPGN